MYTIGQRPTACVYEVLDSEWEVTNEAVVTKSKPSRVRSGLQLREWLCKLSIKFLHCTGDKLCNYMTTYRDSLAGLTSKEIMHAIF